MKVIWIVLGILIALIAGVVAFGFFWWSSNQEVMMQRMEQAASEAQEVARSGDTFACVAELKQRVTSCDDLTCQVADRVFMERCLSVARKAESFCDSVPVNGSIFEKSGWATEQCKETKSNIQACVQAIMSVPEYCLEQQNGDSSL